MQITEVQSLYDEAKPYARFYTDGDNYAQIHTRRVEGLGFGHFSWNITASQCGDDGFVLMENDAPRIILDSDGHPLAHAFTVQAETQTDLAAGLEAQRLIVAKRLLVAAQLADAAAQVF